MSAPTQDEIEKLARELYKKGAPIAPSWDQLGDITKSVWRDRARAELEKKLP